jgi:hypothetical protein
MATADTTSGAAIRIGRTRPFADRDQEIEIVTDQIPAIVVTKTGAVPGTASLVARKCDPKEAKVAVAFPIFPRTKSSSPRSSWNSSESRSH